MTKQQVLTKLIEVYNALPAFEEVKPYEHERVRALINRLSVAILKEQMGAKP